MLKWIFGLMGVSQLAFAGSAAGSMNHILTAQYLKKKKSFIYSPISLEVALSMAAEGSAGDTRQQFQKILGLPNSEIYKKLNLKDTNYDFVSAQKVWLEKDYMILPAFEKALTEDYKSSLEKADFKNNYAAVVPVINKWAAEKTKDRIQDLIPKDGLTNLTRLVLVNAVYFKAKWRNEFDSSRTRDGEFKTSPNTKKTVQFMRDNFYQLNYLETKDFSSIVLPYVGDDISFHVFLPNGVGGEFSKSFLESIQAIKSSDYKKMTVSVVIPRFKTEYAASVIDHLKPAGLTLPFDSVKADFSKISSTVKKSKEEVLYISKIFHKAFIEVGEKGTEATAATAVEMSVRGAGPSAAKPKEFIADHPFLYFIKQKDQILFTGYFAGNE